jgi:hypothetical protein
MTLWFSISLGLSAALDLLRWHGIAESLQLLPATPSSLFVERFDYDLASKRFQLFGLLEELNRSLQHFIAAVPDALDRWRDFDMRHQADALQLPPVRMTHVVAGERYRDPSWEHE